MECFKMENSSLTKIKIVGIGGSGGNAINRISTDDTNVEIIGLDTRYFRSKLMGNKKEYLPNINPNASILGKNQWQWFKSQMTNSNADIIIIE